MQTLSLAWRNIWRNRRRTLLTAGAVAFACTVLSFTISLQQSSYKTAIEASASIFQGHLQIQRIGYQDEPKLSLAFPFSSNLQSLLSLEPSVAAYSPRVNAFSLASSDERTFGVQIFGVDPLTEPLVSSIPGTIRAGRYLQAKDSSGAVIGKALSENLKVSLGDELTLLGQGADGSMAAGIVSIVGIFSSGSTEIDRTMIQIPLPTAQEIFSLPSEINALVVRSTNLTRSNEIANRIQQILPNNLRILTWDELNPGLKEAIELDMVSGWLFLFSLILIVAFGVLNTFLMSLLERIREFGLLMALGMKAWSLIFMVSLELLCLLLTGTLPGVVMGLAIITYFSIVGFSVPGAEELTQLWNLPAVLYPQLNPLFLLSGPTVVVVITFVLVVPFSLRLRRINPVEALTSV
ncbi:MAG: ABC transporter permease [Bdellovibrionales bacterium]|nr:ABC transporter permease [Bdellovibrionales bacterium]